MALPPPGERTPRPPKGKSKSRRYAMTYVNYTKDSTDEANHRFEEVKSTSVASAHTALTKIVREKYNLPDLKKNMIVVLEAALLPPRMSLEDFLGLGDAEDETEEE